MIFTRKDDIATLHRPVLEKRTLTGETELWWIFIESGISIKGFYNASGKRIKLLVGSRELGFEEYGSDWKIDWEDETLQIDEKERKK